MTKFSELKAVQEIQREYQDTSSSLEPFRLEFPRIEVPDFSQNLTQLVAGVTEVLEENERRVRGAVSKFVTELPLQLQEPMVRLAQHGWFMDPEMGIFTVGAIAKALDGENDAEALAHIEGFFEERTNAIEQRLADNYPERKHILRDAFEAHRQCKFNLSVPVLLIQADGMFDSALFMGKRRQSAVENFRSASRALRQSFFDLFNNSMPLWQNENERDSSFDALNRHQVLHGESTKFGTQRNSLQCISLLSFLNWLLNPN